MPENTALPTLKKTRLFSNQHIVIDHLEREGGAKTVVITFPIVHFSDSPPFSFRSIRAKRLTLLGPSIVRLTEWRRLLLGRRELLS